jgi:hypothetical protein
MRCIDCDAAEVSERPDRTAQGDRRFRYWACGKQLQGLPGWQSPEDDNPPRPGVHPSLPDPYFRPGSTASGISALSVIAIAPGGLSAAGNCSG